MNILWYITTPFKYRKLPTRNASSQITCNSCCHTTFEQKLSERCSLVWYDNTVCSNKYAYNWYTCKPRECVGSNQL